MENIRIQDDLYMHVNQETLDKLVIPDGITAIGKYAFMHVIGLTEVILPDSIEEIESSVFSGCKSLEINLLFNAVNKVVVFFIKC